MGGRYYQYPLIGGLFTPNADASYPLLRSSVPITPPPPYTLPSLLIYVCMCTWPTVRGICTICEVVVFQPWTVTPPHLGSVAIVTLKLSLPPHMILPFLLYYQFTLLSLTRSLLLYYHIFILANHVKKLKYQFCTSPPTNHSTIFATKF